MIDVRELSYEVLRAIIDVGSPSDELYRDAQREMNRRVRDWVDNMPSSDAAPHAEGEKNER